MSTLKLTGTTLKVHHQLLLEPPLETFKQFSELYNLAFSLIEPDDSFSTAWTYNDDFRNAIHQALLKYGLKESLLAKLTASEYVQLLLIDGNQPGLIFQQNACFPKLNTTSPTGRKSRPLNRPKLRQSN